jgi:hypothetical protein
VHLKASVADSVIPCPNLSTRERHVDCLEKATNSSRVRSGHDLVLNSLSGGLG